MRQGITKTKILLFQCPMAYCVLEKELRCKKSKDIEGCLVDDSIESHDPLAYLASSEEPIGDILKKAAAMPENRFVLILKNEKKFAEKLLPAYLNAHTRFEEGSMKSRKLQIEIMLFLGGSLRIDEAVRRCTAKDNIPGIERADSDTEAKIVSTIEAEISESEHGLGFIFGG